MSISLQWLLDGIAAVPANEVRDIRDITLDSREVRAGSLFLALPGRTVHGLKFAAEAAYALLDNKLCGDWQGLPKCPEMETGLYEKYAKQFPDGPKTAEALYNATSRQAALVTMYTVQEDRKKAADAVAHTQALAQDLKAKFPQSDYAARAASLAYKVQQGIATYGSDRD